MVFLKHFDTSKQTLQGVGKTYVQKNSKVADLYPIINERMRWSPVTPIKLYEVGHRQRVLVITHGLSL
jgi:ubiquitin carboxyl-terminal hydrolase 7